MVVDSGFLHYIDQENGDVVMIMDDHGLVFGKAAKTIMTKLLENKTKKQVVEYKAKKGETTKFIRVLEQKDGKTT